MSIARVKPQIVYHYCDLETFFAIFSNSTIRLSNISKSNDSEEITYLIPKMKKFCTNLFIYYNDMLPDRYKLQTDFINNVFDFKFNETSLNFYVICFSEESDLLSQWRGYANDACGVSIGFSTDLLYPLARSVQSSYNFSQVKYSLDDLYDQIEKYTNKEIKKNFNGDPQNDSLALLNVVDTTLSVILYNSILYKNPNFSEEREWRLVYNPFGNIRRITDKMAYYDRMAEMFNKSTEKGGFVRTPMTFHISNDKIISHIDLSFESIKKNFIREIIVGSKASINDLDLELFLLSNGYNPLKIYIHKSNIPYR
ncbi:MAG: DUF2971 domain-containing protein [Clostridium sp.]|nr:DUF2971 domain-containing protein [Clostridium sp.]